MSDWAGQGKTPNVRLVIAASAAGTVFEFYDFFIYGTLASFIAAAFIPSDNETVKTLTVWAGFAVGFGFRPLGAILFGYLGDRLGRKYTFLATVTLMGAATAAIGLVPGVASIGLAAPLLIILLRVIQGLALGGEYGGAAIYVAEHSPPGKRGFYTGFIQSAACAGFLLSILVVLGCKSALSAEDWAAWGWRLPFLGSVVLLAISLWMRLKLNESPVFQAMRAEGRTSANPFRESFTWPGNKKRIFVALLGVAAGQAVIFYVALFASLNFLKGPMRMDDTAAELIVGGAALAGIVLHVMFGALSDKLGRKPLIIAGYALALVAIFPAFHAIGWVMAPSLAAAAPEAKIMPSAGQSAAILAALVLLVALVASIYGGIAALLTEMFPPQIRYSSISIPYHFGSGYFGGFLPLVSAAIVAETGDPYSGLWYAWVVVALALAVSWWGLKGGPPQDYVAN